MTLVGPVSTSTTFDGRPGKLSSMTAQEFLTDIEIIQAFDILQPEME